MPNGEYTVSLSDGALFAATGLHAAVSFSLSSSLSSLSASPAPSGVVALSGEAGVYSAPLSVGAGTSTWFQSFEYTAPLNAAGSTPSAFGSSVSLSAGVMAVGSPQCDAAVSSCSAVAGGTVDIYEVYSETIYERVSDRERDI